MQFLHYRDLYEVNRDLCAVAAPPFDGRIRSESSRSSFFAKDCHLPAQFIILDRSIISAIFIDTLGAFVTDPYELAIPLLPVSSEVNRTSLYPANSQLKAPPRVLFAGLSPSLPLVHQRRPGQTLLVFLSSRFHG